MRAITKKMMAYLNMAPASLAIQTEKGSPNPLSAQSFKRSILTIKYNATPGSAQRDIKAAMRLYAALKELADKYPKLAPEAFAVEYRKTLAKVQNSLGSPGFAPIASLDTANADTNRKNFIR